MVVVVVTERTSTEKRAFKRVCMYVGIAEFGFAKIKDPDINLHVTLPTFTAPN